MLEWKKKCKKDQTLVSDRKIWESKCENYKVVFSHIRFGEGSLPDQYLALKRTNNIWDIMSKHRTRKAAENACENFTKSHQ